MHYEYADVLKMHLMSSKSMVMAAYSAYEHSWRPVQDFAILDNIVGHVVVAKSSLPEKPLPVGQPETGIEDIQERNCLDIWNNEIGRTSGDYWIDVDGEGSLEPIEVECDMGDAADSHQVDNDRAASRRGRLAVCSRLQQAAGEYARNITYRNATESHVLTLIDSSYSCQQYIRWSCKGGHVWVLVSTRPEKWVGRGGPQYYWGGGRDGQQDVRLPPLLLRHQAEQHLQLRRQPQGQVAPGLGAAARPDSPPRAAARFRRHGGVQRGRRAPAGPPPSAGPLDTEKSFVESLTAPASFDTQGLNDKSLNYLPPFTNYTGP
ncbi:neurexin-4 [Caerostris extrusa]|uniref:Neurexin-4 n=1 Tax=Caerostris extrusa TaxID=172846 RepID=A0AAV4Q4A7_CAEEX|nr:neurexin-4 [Caerostris extrusa]